MKLQEILRDSDYSLNLFDENAIKKLESKIITKNSKNGLVYYIPCLIRDKDIKLTPEEVVRQLYLDKLMSEYGYTKNRIKVEYPVAFGSDINSKKADICILCDEIQQEERKNKDPKASNEYIIIELKNSKVRSGIEQLKSYANATGVPFALWCNGNMQTVYHRENPNIFIEIQNLPKANETLDDVLHKGFKYVDLLEQDVLQKERVSLKDKILLIEDDVLANSGEDAFEEVFKLIFAKLFDELETYRKDKQEIQEYNTLKKHKHNDRETLEKLSKKMKNLDFAIYEQDNKKLYDRIQDLFTRAKKKWKGIFDTDSKIALTPNHLAVCVSNLQKCKFFNSNLEVIDEAFEYLANKNSKGEKGQYFTPRYVIDMCVKMLNPKRNESMIDTASGSCGFPIHTCFYVWREIYRQEGKELSEMLTAEEKIEAAKDYVKDNVFAIDFDPRTVRISKMLNLIAGDGHTNVFKLNSLDFKNWEAQKQINEATKIFNENFENLAQKAQKDKKGNTDYKNFLFDIVMANPPFAGDIKEFDILESYEVRKSISLESLNLKDKQNIQNVLENPTYPEMLTNPSAIILTQDGYKKIKIKNQAVVTRDILFIERNLNMLRPGGRMAIVLPQGRFNNSSDKYIREFIADKARILAVVGLHQNVFKPHTGTKTSVLFLQKWGGDDGAGGELCPKREDYNIFFATQMLPSKDNSGEKIYVEESYICIRQYKNDKQILSEEELSQEQFFIRYKSLEEANFIKLDNACITKEKYNNLNEKDKKRVIRQEASVLKRPLLDSHGHMIVKHDLFNHEGLTQDGITEAFIEFAKSENLSFWRE